jgi:hypothetical protein
VNQLIPDGFLTPRQAAEELAVAMYSGPPDRSAVVEARQAGFDVYDGAARDEAFSELWKANGDKKIAAFLISPSRKNPFKLPPAISEAIVGVQFSRVGDLSFLRQSNPYYHRIVAWMGRDLSVVSVVFKEGAIKRLARQLIRLRRRKSTSGHNTAGRPSRRSEVRSAISTIVDAGKWQSTQSIKALTAKVNRVGKWPKPISEDTVARCLQELHNKTKDRRYERITRTRGTA